MMNRPPPPAVTEAELQAWVDGVLAAERQDAVAAYLAARPAEAQRLHAYRQQAVALRARYNPVLDEALPARLAGLARPGWRFWRRHAAGNGPLARYAAMLALTLSGLAGGWLLHGQAERAGWTGAAEASDGAARRAANFAAHNVGNAAASAVANSAAHQAARLTAEDGAAAQQSSADPAGLAHRAAVAYAVYSPEVRHPVEVGADQQDHLVAWLSKRLGAQLRAPQLQALGYELIGGRLLPGQSGPVAQFMYHDAGGQRLTLYVSTEQRNNLDSGFRFAQEGQVGVFYWIDGKFGYALSAAIGKPALGKIADAVYAQLEPAS